MRTHPVFEFHISRASRERCRFDGMLFATSGRLVLGDPAAARRLAASLTRARGGEPVASGADLFAMGLIDEAMHLAVGRYRESCDPRVWLDALAWFEKRLGHQAMERTLLAFTEDFPPLPVHRGAVTAREWLELETGGVPHRAVALEELMMLWLGNANPACAPYRELFDDEALALGTSYAALTATLREYFETRPRFGPENANLVDFLRAPMAAAPRSLTEQLDWMRTRWAWLLGDLLVRMLVALDVLREEARWFESREHARRLAAERHFGGDSGPGAIPRYGERDVEYERFSRDEEWMPRCVLMAKSTFVWLDQLARQYQRPVTRLDEIPEEELERLGRFGVTGLWLIGLWERSHASQRIKQLCGNPDAAASAYSLHDYAIAPDLGGDEAYAVLRDRAAKYGVRLASDMVPNHMGIDSKWVIEHPEWFLSLPHPPYPAYTFDGPDLSSDARVELKIEDHYFDRSDAAVVFRRHDRWTGDTRYVYHGNDGTSFPWNDTAQIDYLNPAAREQVIQTILHVARQFPIIRFDAAMTLARRHVQRLWFPEPGSGGAIPSRAEHGMTGDQFLAAMPNEFWREVVDRVAHEAPGTLLLAEAFWLMEGYFVRTLGMHRVYNSAFMNMLRDEKNANYRSVIKNTIEFDPEILQRYVNFMNNPDERTAVDQFGRGEKYFGTCVMLSTLPGLPMFGHGQLEGFEEKYGMEFRRASKVEDPDVGMVAEHWRRISPLLHRRGLFSGASDFRLYDCWSDSGGVNEDVYAYSNRRGHERALVLYHNRWADARGWIRTSVAFADKRPDGSRPLKQVTLGEAFGLDPYHAPHVRCREVVTGREYLFDTHQLAHDGLRVELPGYGSRVYVDWTEVPADGRPWGELCNALQGQGCESLDDRMLEHELAPVHHALASVPEALGLAHAGAHRATNADHEATVAELRAAFEQRVRTLIARAHGFAHGASAALAGIDREHPWDGDVTAAVADASEAYARLLRVPALIAGTDAAADAEAKHVLPSLAPHDAAREKSAVEPWVQALTWLAVRALGRAADAINPEGAALQLFDSLRLARGVHEAFGWRGLGDSDEDRWRRAALVRVAIGHPHWRALGVLPVPAPWTNDDEARWLIGVHDHDGTRWFGRESHARLVWWRTLPALLEAAGEADAKAPASAGAIAWAKQQLADAEASGWRFERLVAEPETKKAAAPVTATRATR